jgi:AraC family transcriptional regulator, transcriptional activator FtrA
MTTIVIIMPNSLKTEITGPKHNVVVLAHEGMALFEFSIAVEIFGLPRPEMGPSWYGFQIAGIGTPPFKTTGGISLRPEHGLESLKGADTIIITGRIDPSPPHLIEALISAYGRGARLMSICSGVFTLAATGLLDTKRATTHWRYTDELKARYPAIHVIPDVLYVDEGQILTSAGSAAGIDLCLYLVGRDYGAQAANQVARTLVVPLHREGGQAQFIQKAVALTHDGKRLGPLMDQIRQTLNHPYSLTQLAKMAGMSKRTFLRRFEESTGLTPAKWLLNIRIQYARDLLETTSQPIEVIAKGCGLGSPHNLRHHFREYLKTTPSAYRASFSRLNPS